MPRRKKNSQPARVGRPPRSMPPRIDASPEEIARVVLNVKPPKKWRYLEEKNPKD